MPLIVQEKVMGSNLGKTCDLDVTTELHNLTDEEKKLLLMAVAKNH